MSGRRVVIIACGRGKVNRTCLARDMYTSSYFRCGYQWARSITDEKNIYILSAKYGVISTTTRISPYNIRFGHADAITPEQIARQVKELGLEGETPILLGGTDYHNILSRVFPSIKRPFAKFGKMGYQSGAYKKHKGVIPE